MAKLNFETALLSNIVPDPGLKSKKKASGVTRIKVKKF